MEVDERLRWLESRITSSLRPRNDDLKALFANDDNRHAFLEFCNNEDVRRLFVFTKPPKHTLCASLYPPHEVRSKAVFFLKTNQASKLTKDNIREDVVYSDCDTVTLQQLDLLAKEIYLPLLCTDGAQTYGGVSSDKLMDVLHRLMGTLEVTEGHVEGKITLPLPSIEVLAEAAALPTRRAAVIHVLESSVIGWIKQIKLVLKHDPMHELQRRFGNRPGPMDEVQMWQDRRDQLHSINQQLDSPIASDILMNLDEANSTYSHSFHNVRKDITKALVETNENLKFLSTLLPWFEQLHDATKPSEMLRLFSPVIHTMTLVWSHSRYYHDEKKFNNLLRLVSNEVVARAESMVGPDVVQNPLQSYTRLKDALRICAAFRGTYLDFKDKADAINAQRNSETEEAMTLNPPKGVLYSTKLYGISAKRKTDILAGSAKDPTQLDMTSILKDDEWTDSPWPPRNAPCFDVMNSFMERCNDVLELVQTVRHFHLLETTAEVGGAGTQSLDSLVREIHEEFVSAMNEFSDKVGEDVLDISDGHAFEKAFFAFRSVVKDLEKRLAIVLRQSFLQCPTIGAQLRLLEVFEGISGREMVQENLKDKDRHLVNSLTGELISVKSMFHATMRKPPLHSNMPPAVSNLIWIRALKSRVQDPMEKLRRISPQSLEGDTGWHVRDIFADCMDDFDKYEQKIIREWQNNIVTELRDRLKQPLLVADDYDEEQDIRPQSVNVNLDPELYLLLREVHYLAQAPYNVKIPDDVRALLRNTDAATLRTTAARLETIVAKYNTVMRTITDFERPLFERKLGKIDHLFEQGLSHYTWKMTESADFIELAHSLVCSDLHHNLSIVQSNCHEMIDISESWSKMALDVFEVRDHDQSYSMDFLIDWQKELDEDHQSYVIPSGNKIHQLLQSSFEAVEISRASPAWEEYVAHMDALVLNGLKQTTVKSLRSMLNTIVHSNMAEKQGTITPVLTIRMELIENFVSFTPPLDQSTAVVSVQERVTQWLSGFRARGSLVRMLGSDEKHGYEEYITMDEDVHQFTQQILMMVRENGEECKELLKLFTNYTFLWLQDINATFEEFLQGRLTPNPRRNPSKLDAAAGMREIASARSNRSVNSDRLQTQINHINVFGASTASNSIGASGLMGTAERSFLTPKRSRDSNINVPTLDMFDSEIDIYKSARDEIADLQNCQDVGWLRVDLMPIKQVLTTYASRWMWTFTKYLSDQVTDLLTDLDSFLKHIEPEIESITGEERDTASFMKMMRLFNEVSAKQQEMDGKFTAMNRTVLLIKKYKQELPESTQHLFDAAPGRWNNLKTKVSLAKQRLGPRIQEEADRITRDLAAFGERVDAFNQELSASEIYTRECSIEQAYELIGDFTKRLDELDSEAQDLIELQELLETAVVNFTIIPECRHELKNLKQVWETVRLVEEQQNEWKRERWQKMNTKYLREATNDQLEMVNGLSEEVQLWDVYLGMQDSILVIQACLPLIDDLSNPAMRPRHWKQLVRVIGVMLQIDNDSLNRMTLGQLLQLGLHNHVDEVRSIVHRAVKDVAIESALRTYEEIWLSKIFELRAHVRSAVPVEGPPAEDTATKSEMSDSDMDKDKSRANVSRRTQSRMSSVTGGQSRNRRTSVSSLPASLLNLGDLNVLNETGGLFLLHDTEPVFEELEAHQVSLQAMQNSSVAGSFLDEVIKWQKRLQTIEAVLSVWLDVQDKWVELEEVFSGADVRTTLSQEAKLFNSANRDFRLLMRATEKNPNVLQCCQRKGILVALEKMNTHLEQCWKSLLHHLERRRQKFPRFYFLSLEDVLHIICNGYDVGQANLYLPKLFENLGKLEYEDTVSEANDSGVQITSVISNMGEKLPLKQVVPCDGHIENWLSVLLPIIRASIQQQVASALGQDVGDVTQPGRPDREIHSAGARKVTVSREERKGSSRAGSRLGSRKSKRAGSKTPGEDGHAKEQSSQKSWMLDHVTEVVYLATQIDLTTQTERCLKAVDGGERDAMQETMAKVNKSIEAAVVMLKGLEDEKERRARREKEKKKERDSVSTKEESIPAKEDSRSLSETISQTGRHSSQQSFKGSHLSLTEQPPIVEEGSVITEKTEPTADEVEPKTPEAVDTMKVVLPPERPKVKVEVEEAIDKSELKLMLFPSQIQKISNLIALLAHQRDVMRRFVETVESGSGKSGLLESFDWKAQLQYQWNESNMGINIKIMDSEFDYGYEYMGSANRAVVTPMTERVFVSLTQAIKANMAGLCVSPNWCGSRETIQELSISLGKPVYMFNCSKTLDSFMLGDVFKGLASTGAWICLSNIDYIKPDVLSICAQLLQTILDSLRSGKTSVSIQSDDVTLNPQAACFATMDSAINLAHNDPEKHLLFDSSVSKLPSSLIRSFRVISVTNPDLRVAVEVMLLSQGFLSATELSYKVVALQEMASNLLSTLPPIAKKHSTYNPTMSQGWSLQTLQSIIQEAGSILDEMLTVAITEELMEETLTYQDELVGSFKQSSEVGGGAQSDSEPQPTTEQPSQPSTQPPAEPPAQAPTETEKGAETAVPPDEKRFENEALVLALRDSSMPKLHGQDADVFITFLQDLFPDVDVPLDFGGNTDRTETIRGMKLNTPVVNVNTATGTQAFTPLGSNEKQALEDINEAIAVATAELSLVPGVVFQARVSQFALLTNTHQCVLVVGPAGCGKSECINTYVGAQREMGKIVGVQRVFTRAVESEELLGYIDPTTKEWKDGLFQSLIRKHCLQSSVDFINSKPLVKVVHMDGEVDAPQMEILGSVFNRNNSDVLIMGNNERIRLSDSVRVLWEMESLADVSPSVLSKVGIISMDKSDVGWQLIIARWLATRSDIEQDILHTLMDVYVEPTLDFLAGCTQPAIMGKSPQPRMQRCIDTSDMNLVSTLCSLMEALLSQQTDLDDLQYERYFNFACIWAFGGTLEQRYRSTFSHWWRQQWSKRIDYPEDGEVWDYLVDSETNEFIHWQDAVPVYSMPPHEGIPEDAFVHTMSIEQLSYLLGLLSDAGKPVMLVGDSGCGKTAIVNDRIRTVCSGEVAEVLALTVHANRFTTARLLWQRLEERLEWKHGRTYVPKGNKKLMCLVDDLNLAKVDSSGSQSACEMVRQHIDCGGVYDPDKRAWRTVNNVTYVTTLNPSISASVPKPSQRLLRHFAVLGCPYPSANETHAIFSTLVNTHFLTPHTSSATGIREKILHSEFKEEEQLRDLLSVVVKVTIEVQDKMRSMFLPTAERCHYIFTLRDMMTIFRNICLSLKPRCKKEDLLLLWRHECQWVYGEKCVNSVDADRYQLAFVTAARKLFTNEELLQTVVSTDQPMFSNLVEQDSGIVMAGVYRPSSGSTVGGEEDSTDQYQACWQEDKLRFLVEHSLEEYNKTHPRMKLALYRETIERVCRIARSIHSPHKVGHQLLVAEGCPGLASIMTKLAANLCGYTVFNINPSPVTSSVDYKMDQFKSDLVTAYTKTAVKGEKILLLMNEDELLDEDFLIYVGEFIENGSITHLFSYEEQTTIINSIRTEVTAAGLTYTREVAWNYFLKTVQNNFRVVLTSSSGSTAFQRRCREYPTVTSHLRCLWFPHWSKEKLVAHAFYHLKDLTSISYIQKENLAHLLATIHIAIRHLDGRERDAGSYNHLTNTSYEKFIERFISVAKERDEMIENEHAIMTQALQHIDKENELAFRLKKQLEHEKVVLEERKEGTVKLLSQIGQDTAIAEQQVKIVRKQEEKIENLRKALPRYQIAHERAIFKASRIVKDTKQVVESLDTTSLAELRSMQKPDVDIEDLMGAIIMILKSPSADLTWSKGAKRQMANMDRFIDELMGFDENQLPEPTLNLVEPYLKKTSFIPENMMRKTNNVATGSLCKWLRGVIRYHRLMISKVKPLHSKVEETAAAVEDAEHKLSTLQNKRKALEDRLADLANGFEEATVDKNDQDEKTRKMDQQLETAAKFRQILATEHEHCLQIYESLPRRKAAIPGSAAMAAAFATYLGPYDHNFRRAMLTIHWPMCLRERGVPLVIDSIDPMKGRIVDWAIDGGRATGLNTQEPSFVIIEEEDEGEESGIEDDGEDKEEKQADGDAAGKMEDEGEEKEGGENEKDDGEREKPTEDAAENVEDVKAGKAVGGGEMEFANTGGDAMMETSSEMSESRYAYTAETLPNITQQEYTQYTRALVKIMVGDKVLQEWITKGLSPREIENAAILQTSWQRPPLIIDPYMNGVKWMRRSVPRRSKLICVDMQTRFDPSIIVQIEKAILGGHPVLLMNCEPHVDSMVTPLIHHRNTANEKDEKEALLSNFDNYVDGLINSIMQARTQTNAKEKERNKDEEPRMIRYSSRRLLCHENFRLYMQTGNGSATFNPEVSSTSALIGYTTSAETLQDELLSRAFARVRPELYMERKKVLKAIQQHRITLYDLENLLIEKLKGEKTDIWEQTEYVSAIVDAKEQVAGKLEEAQQVLGELDQLQEELFPVAKRAALLFSILRSLEGIQREYIFALPFFLSLFDRAVGEEPPPEEEEEEDEDDDESTAEDELHALLARPVSVSTKCSDEQDQEKKDDDYADEKFDDDDDENAEKPTPREGGEAGSPTEANKAAQISVPDAPQLPTEGVDYNNMSANQVKQILDSLTQTVFQNVRQSLYEEHRLLFATMLCLNIQNESSDHFAEEEMALLLQGNPGFGNMVLSLADFDCDEPVPQWLPVDKWDDVIAMSVLPGPLDSLCVQVAENSEEWEAWYKTDMPENEPLPMLSSEETTQEAGQANDDEGAVTNASPDLGPMTDFHQLLILRMLRPDRLPIAMAKYVNKHMTSVKHITPSISSIQGSANTSLGILVMMPPKAEREHFISSITLNTHPVEILKQLAQSKNIPIDVVNIAEGCEAEADIVIDMAVKNDGWVVLQDLHLASQRFSKELRHHLIRVGNTGGPMGLNPIEKEGTSNFRVWITSQPSEDIASALLQSLRVINWDNITPALLVGGTEDTDGADNEFQANTLQDVLKIAIASALDSVSESQWNQIRDQSSAVKGMVFGICVVHGILVARQSYGCRGISQWYAFSQVQIQQAVEAVAGPSAKAEGGSEPKLQDVIHSLTQLVYGNLIQNDWDKLYVETIVSHVMSATSSQSGNLMLGSVAIGTPPANVDPANYSQWLSEKWLNEGNSSDALSLDFSVEKHYNQTNGIDFLKYIDKLYELQHSGPHDHRVRLHMKKEMDTYRLQHAMDMVIEQLPPLLELGAIPDQILNEGYSFPYHVPSIISLASTVVDEMPETFGYVLLQECHWLNALLCHVRQSLHELDKHILGGEHAIPQEFTEVTQSLQEEFVPISWIHPLSQPTTHSLLSWLKDLNKRHSQLKQWVKEGKVPTKNNKNDGARGELTSVWLGGLVNPNALITALRQEKAVISGCLLTEVELECDVSTSIDCDSFDIEHEGGMYLRGLYLQGASWDIQNGCLSPPKTELNLMPSVYIRPVVKSTATDTDQSEQQDVGYFECPVCVNKARQITAFTLRLRCPLPVEQWKQAGTAIVLDPGAPEDSVKKSKGFMAIKREVAMIEDDAMSERVPSSIGSRKSGLSDNASEHSRMSRRSARSLRSRLSDQALQQQQQRQAEKFDSTWSVRSETLGKERYSYSMFDYRAPTLREKRLEERQRRRQEMLDNQNQNNNLEEAETAQADGAATDGGRSDRSDKKRKDDSASERSAYSYKSDSKKASNEDLDRFESESDAGKSDVSKKSEDRQSRHSSARSGKDSMYSGTLSRHSDTDEKRSLHSARSDYSEKSGKRSQASIRSEKSTGRASVHSKASKRSGRRSEESFFSDAKEDSDRKSRQSVESARRSPSVKGDEDRKSLSSAKSVDRKSVSSAKSVDRKSFSSAKSDTGRKSAGETSPRVDDEVDKKSVKSSKDDTSQKSFKFDDEKKSEKSPTKADDDKDSFFADEEEETKSQKSVKADEDRASRVSFKSDSRPASVAKEEKDVRKSQSSLRSQRDAEPSNDDGGDDVDGGAAQRSKTPSDKGDVKSETQSVAMDLHHESEPESEGVKQTQEDSGDDSKAKTDDDAAKADDDSDSKAKADDDGDKSGDDDASKAKAEDDKVSADGDNKQEADYDYEDDFSTASDAELKKKVTSDEDDFDFDSPAKSKADPAY